MGKAPLSIIPKLVCARAVRNVLRALRCDLAAHAHTLAWAEIDFEIPCFGDMGILEAWLNG